MRYAKEGLRLAKKNKFPKGITRNMNRIGSILRVMGDYPEALEMHIKTLEICENNHDLEGMAKVFNSIGIVYSEQKDSEKALSYFFKTKGISEQINNINLLTISLENIGFNFAVLNKLDSARFYTQKAYEIALKRKNDDINVILLNLGDIHSRMNLYALALDYYRMSAPRSIAIDDNTSLSQTYYEMAVAFKKENNADSCMYYAEKSLETAQKIKTHRNISQAGFLLTNLYENKDQSKAFHYFKIAVAAKDSIFDQEKIKQIQKISFDEQLRQEILVEEKKATEEERKENLQHIAIAIFIVTLFTFVILMGRRKANARLVELMGLIALLLFFEFINLLAHPFIEHITHHVPMYMLLLLVLLASVLAPVHHYLIHWIKINLVHKTPKSSLRIKLIPQKAGKS